MNCFVWLRKFGAHSRKRQSAGFSLLEFSLSSILVIPMLIATLDLTKLFQARSSAKAAVNTALRCATVTDDPSCSTTQTLATKATYRVRLSSAESIIPLVSYGGEVKYIEGPKFKVGPLRALVLDQGYTKVSGTTSLTASIPIMSVVADVKYSAIDSYVVPQIKSSSVSAKEPNFEEGHARVSIGAASRGAEAVFSSSGEGSGPITPHSKASISDEFSVPKIFDQSNCIGGGSYPSNGPDSDNCFGTDPSGKRFVRGIIHVEGSGNASSKNVCGRALLELQVLDSSGWRLAQDLSGQSFQGSAGNFIPRGYRNDSTEIKLVNDVIAQYYQTPSGKTLSEAFQGEIKFELNRKYRVVVRTQVDTQLDSWNPSMKKCSAGEVSYKISGGNVYFAKIHSVTKQVNCAETVEACSVPKTCSEATSPQVLSSSRLAPKVFAALLNGPPRAAAPTADSIVKDCGINIVNPDHFNQLVENAGSTSLGSCSCKSAKLLQGPTSAPQIFGPVTCPQDNKGVSDATPIEGIITNSIQAQQVCPLPLPQIGSYKIPESKVIRTWKTKELLVADSLEYDATDCQDLASESIISNLWDKSFPEYLMPVLEAARVSKLNTKSLLQSGRESASYPSIDPADPYELLKGSRYNCGEFNVKTVSVEKLEKQADQSVSIFDFSEPRLNCSGGSDVTTWKTMLSNNLRQVYSNVENAFFIPRYRNSNKVFRSTCGSHPPYSSPEESSLCNPFFTLNDVSTSSKLLEETSDGTLLPAICLDPCNRCQLELASLPSGLNSVSQRQKEKALAKARAQLQTFSPWLGRDCGEKDCASLDLQDQGSRVKGTATIKVPLFTKGLLNSFLGKEIFDGKDHFELRYSSEQSYEKEKAKYLAEQKNT